MQIADLSKTPISFPDPNAFNLTDCDLLEWLDKKHLIFGQHYPIMLGIEGRQTNMKRAVLYLRVSTKNHGQTVETQRLALREFAANRKFEIVNEYADEGISGSKDSRPALDRLMKDAQAKKFDAVIVARFDRFARSTKHLVLALEQFSHLGIDFISLSESVDTSTPMGKMIFTVLGAVAELERNLIRERVAMGLDRARKQKKVLGRPRRVFDRGKAKELHADGLSLREIAAQLGINKGTVRAAISAA
jgi:DNA invertase Pin-like site-specific DNA recombinase